MHGSVATRLARVVRYLATHPRHIAPYVRMNPRVSSPLELGLPWFSWGAIEFLDRYVRPSMTIFEYGSGGSTLYFARRGASVRSVENNADWQVRVIEKLRTQGIDNVEIRLRPYDFVRAVHFEESEYLHAIGEDRFDVVAIDGSEYDVPVRPVCFRHAERHVKPGGIIVVDDSWRYPALRERSRAVRWKSFVGTGPARFGVTSTDVHHY